MNNIFIPKNEDILMIYDANDPSLKGKKNNNFLNINKSTDNNSFLNFKGDCSISFDTIQLINKKTKQTTIQKKNINNNNVNKLQSLQNELKILNEKINSLLKKRKNNDNNNEKITIDLTIIDDSDNNDTDKNDNNDNI